MRRRHPKPAPAPALADDPKPDPLWVHKPGDEASDRRLARELLANAEELDRLRHRTRTSPVAPEEDGVPADEDALEEIVDAEQSADPEKEQE